MLRRPVLLVVMLRRTMLGRPVVMLRLVVLRPRRCRTMVPLGGLMGVAALHARPLVPIITIGQGRTTQGHRQQRAGTEADDFHAYTSQLRSP